MSQIYKDYAKRIPKEKVLEVFSKIKAIFSWDLIDAKLPDLYLNKKDFWDIDFFWLFRKWIVSENMFDYIINKLEKGWIKVKKATQDDIENINNKKNIKLYNWYMIYKVADEYITLIEYNKEYYHIDINMTDSSDYFYKTIYPYFQKPFFWYYLWIISRNFWIKYTTKWIFFIFDEYNDVNIPQTLKQLQVTDNLNDYLMFLNKYFSNGKFLESYNKISTHYMVIDTLELLDIYNYKFFEEKYLTYEEKRKIRSYKINKELQEEIMKKKKDNFSKKYGDYEKWFLELNRIMFGKLKEHFKDFSIKYEIRKKEIEKILKERVWVKENKEELMDIIKKIFNVNDWQEFWRLLQSWFIPKWNKKIYVKKVYEEIKLLLQNWKEKKYIIEHILQTFFN